jgi:D-alanine-D-alanine ligase
VRIAFTHNLKSSDEEIQAEFDTAETVSKISAAIEACGHTVIPVDVTCPLRELIDKLTAADADLVFNTAEGTYGKTREALYPAVFEQLGLPYTGSDAWTLAVTLDKFLTKVLVEQHGVRVPRHVFRNSNERNGHYHPVPCIVKPNYEGSSKGVHEASVVNDATKLEDTIGRVLKGYPEGVIVEEYIAGIDVTVGWFEGLGGEVLTPCSYVIAPEFATPHRIYDYRLKNECYDAVDIACPAPVSRKALDEIKAWTKKCAKILCVHNFARFDFRVRDDETVFFLEANATPSMEAGSSMFVAAKELGLDYVDVIRHVIDNAAKRWAQQERQAKRVEKARQAWLEGARA